MDSSDQSDRSLPERTGQKLVDWLLKAGINGIGPLKSAEECAQEAMGNGRTEEQAIRHLIRTHVTMAGTQGFIANLGGFIVTAVALPANIGASYLLQTRLAAAIARVRGHDLNTEEVRTAILLCLLGNAAGEAIKTVGVKVGEKLTARLIGQISPKILYAINKKVGFRLLTKAGQSGTVVLAKGVPFVGGAIGAGFDAAAAHAVGEFSRRFFSPEGADVADEGDGSRAGLLGLASSRWRPRERIKAIRVTVGRRTGRNGDAATPEKVQHLSGSVRVLFGWRLDDQDDADVELDASAFLCGRDDRVRSDEDFVYASNRSSPDGSLQHPNLTPADEERGARAAFVANLDTMPADVRGLVFALSIYEAEMAGLTFDAVKDVFVEIRDSAGAEILRTEERVGGISDTAVVLGAIERTGTGWQYRTIGQGHPSGLESIAKQYGVNV
jgi:stress response protein SCP2